MDDGVSRKFRKGELLIEPTKEPAGLFHLNEGTVKQYTITKSGEELILNIFKAGSYFPMGWLVNDSPVTHYFEAITDMTATISSKEAGLKLFKENPEVLFDLVKRIYKGLEGYFMRMEYQMTGNAKSRLITELVITAKRFGEIKLKEKDLAAQSGIARETVSRELKKLREEDLIELKSGQILIKDLDLLENKLIM